MGGESLEQCSDCPHQTCREHALMMQALKQLEDGASERKQAISELRATDAEINRKLLEAINCLNEKLGENLLKMSEQIADVKAKQQDNFILLLLALIGAILTILFEVGVI
jgi:hypothetical protein